MTLPFHCPIQPQEHVFSWLNRIHLLFGHVKLKHTLDYLQITFKPFKTCHHNAASLDTIKLYKREIANDTSGLDQHSTIPLWSLTYDSHYYLNSIRDNKAELPSGYHAGYFAFQGNWKYCSHCVQEDISKYGHSFWHVKHQIPGITHCYIHEQQLIEDNVRLRDLRKSLLPEVYTLAAKQLKDAAVLKEWSRFTVSVYEIVVNNPMAGENLASQVRLLLNVPKETAYKDNETFEPLQEQFDKDIPSCLLQFLFLSYRDGCKHQFKLLRSTLGRRQNTGYLIQHSHPICWLIILFWLREKINWMHL
mgnify:CR=1 FL=1|tara:strand:- start:3010 stop:3924 length:915 start_codon:yes stop_codon:yes gene_type:complete